MSRLTQLGLSVVFLLLLIAPVASSVFADNPVEVGNELLEFPAVSTDALMRPSFYREAVRYIRDGNPIHLTLIQVATSLDLLVLGDSPNPDRVFLGEDGWLFFRDTVVNSCAAMPNDVAENLKTFADRIAQDASRFGITVAPSKFSIHPDKLTDNQRETIECGLSNSAALEQKLATKEIPGYVDSWALFREFKSSSGDPYFRTDTHFHFEASSTWIRALMAEVAGIDVSGDVVDNGWIEFHGNLMDFIGLPNTERTRHITIERAVDTSVSSPFEGVSSYRTKPTSSGVEVIAGRTALIGDSFLEIPEQFLVKYFADVTVFDWRQPDEIDAFLIYAAEADTVIVEVSELQVGELFASSDLADRYEEVR